MAQRRMSREDFSQTSELHVNSYLKSDMWAVCSEYELCEAPEYGTPYYAGVTWEQEYPPYLLKPKSVLTEGGSKAQWTRYKPLEDTPHLFLEFARLYDKGFSVKRIKEWVCRYGTLDYSRFAHLSQDNRRHMNTVRAFWGEVCWAAGVLALYEAALNEDASEAQHLAQNEFYFLVPNYSVFSVKSDTMVDRSQIERIFYKSPLWQNFGGEEEEVANIAQSIFSGDYRKYALYVSVWAVDEMAQKFCFPTLGVQGWYHPNPSSVEGGWGFRNLLGAMYMQMRWLIAAGANLERCEYCNRILSFSPPFPGARKPHSHKKYCNKSCRQANYYKNKVKPQRESKGK